MLSKIDHALLHLVNGFAGHSAFLDAMVRQIANNGLFKGIFVAMVLVGIWVWRGNAPLSRRAGVIATIIVSVVAIAVGRALANLLPFSLRPVHSPGVEINMPIGASVTTLEGWSSMPSDHAILYAAIAVSVFLFSRWVGAFLLLHATFIVMLPRVFLGLHWPSDIAVGILVGVAIALLLFPRVHQALMQLNVPEQMERFAIVTYPVLFLSLLQIGTNFEAFRKFASAMGSAMKLAIAN